MRDIVQRLREGIAYDEIADAERAMDEGADEIERLHQICDDLRADRNCVARDMQDEISRLRTESGLLREIVHRMDEENEHLRAEIEKLRNDNSSLAGNGCTETSGGHDKSATANIGDETDSTK